MFFEAAADGVRLRVRLTPKSSKNAITGLGEDSAGNEVLLAKVTAAPQKGKANQALIKLLAKSWSMPAGAFAIIAGQTSRQKILSLEGEPRLILKRLRRWRAQGIGG